MDLDMVLNAPLEQTQYDFLKSSYKLLKRRKYHIFNSLVFILFKRLVFDNIVKVRPYEGDAPQTRHHPVDFFHNFRTRWIALTQDSKSL